MITHLSALGHANENALDRSRPAGHWADCRRTMVDRPEAFPVERSGDPATQAVELRSVVPADVAQAAWAVADGEAIGLRVAAQFVHLKTPGPQPTMNPNGTPRPVKSPRANYSTLIVFRRPR